MPVIGFAKGGSSAEHYCTHPAPALVPAAGMRTQTLFFLACPPVLIPPGSFARYVFFPPPAHRPAAAEPFHLRSPRVLTAQITDHETYNTIQTPFARLTSAGLKQSVFIGFLLPRAR